MTRATDSRGVRWLGLSECAALLCAVLLAAGTRPAQAGVNAWTSHGPDGGQVHALAIHPTTPGTLYAGQLAGGVFMSTDGGDTWSPISAGLTNTDVSALAIDPGTPTTLYAGTRGGVFKSTDGGGTWSNTRGGAIAALAIDFATPPRFTRGLQAVACSRAPMTVARGVS